MKNLVQKYYSYVKEKLFEIFRKLTFSGSTFLAFFLFYTGSVFGQPNYPLDPVDAVFISSDIKNFLEVYQSLTVESDTVQALQLGYLDKASSGFQEYIGKFKLTATSINKSMQAHPDAYAEIKPFYDGLTDFKAEYIELMKRYDEVIPNTMFAPTYLIVADYKGIGQASRFGQLISIEKSFVSNREVLKNTIVHELTHFQQAIMQGVEHYIGVYSKADNMLDLILREGTADFVTYKLVRLNEDQFTKLKNYEKNEVELWEKFQNDLKTQNKDFWLNVSFGDNNKGNPIQLGYGLGYKIVNAYFEQALNNKQALIDALKMENASVFLKKSKYGIYK